MRKTIKYVGFYDIPSNGGKRVSSPAAVNKMNYIANALIEAGYNVEIISPSWHIGDSLLSTKNITKINENLKVRFVPTWKTKNKISRNLKIIFSMLWLFSILLFKSKRNEKILFYHVQWLSLPVRASRLVKKFKVILEVEEIYSDVSVHKNIFDSWEKKLLNAADAYILSTELLIQRMPRVVPNIVIYGSYDFSEQLTKPNNDGLIHLVYSGIIDYDKKGAFNALDMCKYLDDKYHLHILGFGDIDTLINRINEANETNKCKATYDGVFFGEEYVRKIQGWHIGLSTQNDSGKYLESSFPSKILSYLSSGLFVVSSKIKGVEISKISKLVMFYEGSDPRSIAEAVKKINTNISNSNQKIIRKLNEEFIENIDYLFSREVL